MINWQHMVNEIGFYILLCTLIIFCGLVHDVGDNRKIGFCMIMMLGLLIFFNLGVIAYDTAK